MYGTEGTTLGGSFLLVAARSVFPKSRGGGSGGINDRRMEWGASEGLEFPLCILVYLDFSSPFVSNHISKLIFCWCPLCTYPSRSQLCCLNSPPQGGERQQMGLGQRADDLTANGRVVEWKLRASGSYFSPENQLTTEES